MTSCISTILLKLGQHLYSPWEDGNTTHTNMVERKRRPLQGARSLSVLDNSGGKRDIPLVVNNNMSGQRRDKGQTESTPPASVNTDQQYASAAPPPSKPGYLHVLHNLVHKLEQHLLVNFYLARRSRPSPTPRHPCRGLKIGSAVAR